MCFELSSFKEVESSVIYSISMGQRSRVKDNFLEIESKLTDALMIQLHQIFKTSIFDIVHIGQS